MASDPLIDFCKEKSLVLVNQLARWRENFPDKTFNEQLLLNFSEIQEGPWLDSVVALGSSAPVLALPDTPILPVEADSEMAHKLRANFPAIILQWDPLLIIATFNPFILDDIAAEAAILFPARRMRMVLITPHSFSYAAAIISNKGCTFAGNWNEGVADWATAIGQSESTYLDIGMVIEDIWQNSNPTVPVFIPEQFSKGELIPGIDAIIARKTPLNAWVLTNRPFSKEVHDSVMQKIGRHIHLMAVGPREYSRILSVIESAKIEIGGVQRDVPLHISDWGLADNDATLLSRKLVQSAIAMGASDIHMEPKEDRARIRFRIDGDLFEQAPLPLGTYRDVLKRLKILGSMMQEKTGLLQDGSGFQNYKGLRYDLRFSVGIASGGEEAITVRIFNSRIPVLSELGLKELESNAFNWFRNQETGMCLCSGPTGSGKTTLLYALLSSLDAPTTKLITIEQPVEKHFPSAMQITVKETGVLTYPTVIRSCLRQDPNIMMIGEIRDSESANAALDAASSGHLVLSTLHTSSAVGVFLRMKNSFGIEPGELVSWLKLSVAQRLVPRLCSFCKKTRPAKAADIEYFPSASVANPVIGERNGCSVCRYTGFSGRILMMEIMQVNDTVKQIVFSGADDTYQKIEKYNRSQGFVALIDQASFYLQTGEITLAHAMKFVSNSLM